MIAHTTGMNHLKIAYASQGPIHKFEYLKRKLYYCNANIHFNKQCLQQQLIPNYAKIKIPHTSPAAKFTQGKVHNLRIKDELKYLYMKKQQLNKQIYHQHILLANTWGNTWPYIQNTIEDKLMKAVQQKHKNLDYKLKKLASEHTKTQKTSHTFFPRLINKTNITFTRSETKLLEKGPKYNLHSRKKNWLTTLALEAETAITRLPPTERDYYRKQAAARIERLHNETNTLKNKHPETNTLKSIQSKLQKHDAMIASADKGNSLVILPIQQYEAKVQDFIDNNNFQTSPSNPTKTFQNQVRKTINQSPTLIPPNSKWQYINLNPSAPTIKGLIKLHKPNHPIRPVVNWRNAPSYKLSKSFTQNINRFTPLPNAFNITNSTDLINQLSKTPITPTSTLASLDISNMYSNIPIAETRKILENMTQNNLVNPDVKQELLSWFDTITKQNYFLSNDNIIIQKEGLAMGAPSSGILSEIFLQHAEQSHLPLLSQKHKLQNYFRYVDDILLIYDSTHTDIEAILEDFNSIHPKLTFTEETEQNNTLNFLDITIHKTPPHLKFSVYRKPTFTDTLIPYTSNHPTQHKYSAVRFLYNRLRQYQLDEEEYKRESNIIYDILLNNSFPVHSHKPHTPYLHPPHQPPKHNNKNKNKNKWTTFTYTGRETTYITNLFRHSDLQIAFRTNNTIRNLLTHNKHHLDKFSRSGVYQLTCPDCGMTYTGQTGRDFTSRYNEHKRSFRNNTHTSKFAEHLNNHMHSFGPIQDVMKILHFQQKSPHLNTLERFHIHKEAASHNHLNDEHTITPNQIFDTILNILT